MATYPNLPGVPQLASGPAAGTSNIANALAVATTAISLIGLLKPTWGIYFTSSIISAPTTGSGSFLTTSTTATPIILADSFLSITYHNESNLPMFPIENGAFQTYNKVATPYDLTVRLAKANTIGITGISDVSATRDAMKTFLATLESMVSDTNLYAIVTPDAIYNNANLKGYDYKREINNGAGVILADLHFVEIRAAQLDTNSAASATTVTIGTTNTIPPSALKPSTLGALLTFATSALSTAATVAMKH